MFQRLFIKLFTSLILIASVAQAYSQSAQVRPPREEKLLNGLRLVTWNDASADKLTVKLRIHSGAAFDPKDKMGTMALLGDILFPTEISRSFFTDELEGSFKVETTYDYLQLSVTGKPDSLLDLLQSLSTAVTLPQITKENVELVKKARLEKVQSLNGDAGYLTQRALAKKLFGEFPYGRPAEGSPVSLASIDRADIIFAQQRFLTSDNATITIYGKIDQDFAYKACRQLFGNWTKSDRLIPATFRLPSPPDTTAEKVTLSMIDSGYTGWAVSSAARNDKDYYAALVYQIAAKGGQDYSSFLLKGVLSGTQTGSGDTGCAKTDGGINCKPLTTEAFESAKTALIEQLTSTSADALTSRWLDVHTFRLRSAGDDFNSAKSLTIQDVNRYLERIRKEPVAVVEFSKPATTAN